MMLYKVIPAKILNDGNVVEGKKTMLFQTPQELDVGGLYFLRPGKLYRVLDRVI